MSERTGATLNEIVRRVVGCFLRDIEAQGIQAFMLDIHSSEATPTH